MSRSFGLAQWAAVAVLATSGCSPDPREPEDRVGQIDVIPDRSGSARDVELRRRLHETRWVAYAPTNFDPTVRPQVIPSVASMRADLDTLRRAGVDGLILYGAEVEVLPRLAAESGFRQILLGVWDPASEDELAAVERLARMPEVVGTIVGNEGLMFGRYDLATLGAAMARTSKATGKPVATTEVVESYAVTEELLEWSDFVPANAHPFFHAKRDPEDAVRWTVGAYRDLVELAGSKPVLLKEVGLPSAGTDDVSEDQQARYYGLLAQTDVAFALFEAFDGYWKTGADVEPHWGLFRSDRTPKPVVRVVGGTEFLGPLWLFHPSGIIGDVESVAVDPGCDERPLSPPTCWRLELRAGGEASWGGVAWQYPENNWGERPGFDLSGFRKLSFWMRGQRGGETVSLKLGGLSSDQSLHPASFSLDLGSRTLTREWAKVEISIADLNLSNVPTLLTWTASRSNNPRGVVCYLDNVWLEK